jgi:hypothetical protein
LSAGKGVDRIPSHPVGEPARKEERCDKDSAEDALPFAIPNLLGDPDGSA